MEEKNNHPEENHDADNASIKADQNPAEESSQPNTLNTEPKDMEVHHHTHEPHGKKTWKNYFWEFLMLFLAVFCGFLAEYQLEHTIEHQREHQYIESLVADLKSDQTALNEHINTTKKGIQMMDTLIAILNKPSEIRQRTDDLYYLARLAPRMRPLAANSRTFDQLKNSGNFRLIRNLETSNKIMSYYENFPLITMLQNINETEFTEYKRTAAKIFDPAVFLSMEGENDEIKRGASNLPLRSSNFDTLQELSVFAVYLHGTKKGILGSDIKLKSAGTELIKYLEHEYQLSHE